MGENWGAGRGWVGSKLRVAGRLRLQSEWHLPREHLLETTDPPAHKSRQLSFPWPAAGDFARTATDCLPWGPHDSEALASRKRACAAHGEHCGQVSGSKCATRAERPLRLGWR